MDVWPGVDIFDEAIEGRGDGNEANADGVARLYASAEGEDSSLYEFRAASMGLCGLGTSSCCDNVLVAPSPFAKASAVPPLALEGIGVLVAGVSDLEPPAEATAAFSASTYLTILVIFPGFDDRVIMVVTPAEVAKLAATILVDMPPVPRTEPALETSASSAAISSTTSIARASGFLRGLLSYKQSTSVIRNR